MPESREELLEGLVRQVTRQLDNSARQSELLLDAIRDYERRTDEMLEALGVEPLGKDTFDSVMLGAQEVIHVARETARQARDAIA